MLSKQSLFMSTSVPKLDNLIQVTDRSEVIRFAFIGKEYRETTVACQEKS